MSIIGTGIATSVAQAAHQAQQVARRRDKRVVDTEIETQEIEEKLDLEVHAVQEDDAVNTSPGLAIDAQLPEHPKSASEASVEAATDGAALAAEIRAEATAAAARKDDEDGLYSHVDLTA